jgi:tetratricopeptide (TPR) repeat protein
VTRWVLLAGALVSLLVAAYWHPAAPVCVGVAGVLLTAAAASGDRFVLGTALAAYAVRALLAVALQWLSGLDLPSLRPLLEIDPDSGYRFWIVARDPSWYHAAAVQTLVAWREGTELPVGSEIQYFIFTALLYRLFGPNPLNVVLWNALFGAMAVIVGSRIATWLAGPRGARVTAVLIAAWPSAILWSTQLLKDTICLWLTLVLIALIMTLVDSPRAAGAPTASAARWLSRLVTLFAVAFAMHQFRYYIVLILIPASAVFIVYALIRRTRESAFLIVATCAGIVVMIAATMANRLVDLERIFGPAHPEVGHVRAGVGRQSLGDLEAAKTHYDRALFLVDEYPPALRNLASLELVAGKPERAIAYLRRYLARQPGDDEARATLDRLLAPAPEIVSASTRKPSRPSGRTALVRTAPGTMAPPRPATGPPPVVAKAESATGLPPQSAAATPPVVADAENDTGVPPRSARATRPDVTHAEIDNTSGGNIASRAPDDAASVSTTSTTRTTSVAPGGTVTARVAPQALLAPVVVATPRQTLAITGPGSDYSKGKHAPAYDAALEMIARNRASFTRVGGRSAMSCWLRIRPSGSTPVEARAHSSCSPRPRFFSSTCSAYRCSSGWGSVSSAALPGACSSARS